MSGRSCLVGLAIAVALLANGFASKAIAGPGACKPVKACEPVKAVPKVCGPVKTAAAVPVCKPVRPLPPPEACKPVKVCDGVDAHGKNVVLHDHIARFVSRLKKHSTGKEVYYDAPQPAPSQTPPTPAPAPQPSAA